MPPLGAFLAAMATAFLMTSFILARQNERHPFGDSRFRAIWWWLGILILDVLVALIVVFAAFGHKKISGLTQTFPDLHGTPAAIRGAVVGVLAPLAVRSPVRTTSIRGRKEPIGFTYVYDLIRVPMEQRLDERITRLRRGDREKVMSALTSQGWDPPSLRGSIELHVDDLRLPAPEDRIRIRTSLKSAMTLPEEPKQMLALVKVMLAEHFTGLVDECKKRHPNDEDRQRGAEEAAKDAAEQEQEQEPKRI